MDKRLKKHLNTILKEHYSKNDKGHDKNHVKSVLIFAREINKCYNINDDILKVAVYYHDIACWINREQHNYYAKIIVQNDKVLKEYFTEEEINLIATAVYEHRTNSKKSTILSSILSDADKCDACRLDRMIYRAWYYGIHYFENTSVDELLKKCHKVQCNRYGKNSSYRFSLPETYKIVQEDLNFSKKCLDDFEGLFLPYAHTMVRQGILKFH